MADIVGVPMTPEERAAKDRLATQQWIAENLKLGAIPGLGAMLPGGIANIGLPPEATTWIVELVSMVFGKIQEYFGLAVDKAHEWWDSKGFALVKGMRDDLQINPQTNIDPIAVDIKAALAPLSGLLGTGPNDPKLDDRYASALGPQIRAIITSATLDSTGIELAGKQTREAVIKLITEDLKGYGTTPDAQATIRSLAEGIADKLAGGVTTYLGQAKEIKTRLSAATTTLTPEEIEAQVKALNLQFDSVGNDGRVTVALTAIGTIRSAQAQVNAAKAQARAAIIKDITDSGITLDPAKEALIDAMIARGGTDGIDIKAENISTLVAALDKSAWENIFRLGATGISVSRDAADVANGTYDIAIQHIVSGRSNTTNNADYKPNDTSVTR